jgi:NADPH-dependent 2,4-dienoyl-CoA reductase/sulfur reductase-like enzyme
MISHFDVVVAGAGPGGIAAATIASEVGLRVCLVDDNPALGGQIWRGHDPDTDGAKIRNRAAQNWMQRLRASGCSIWPGMRTVCEPRKNILRLEGQSAVRDVAFGRLIVATGARERFLPFPGWTLPGVVGAGAAQALLKSGFEVSGRRAVVSGSGPLLLAVGAGLRSKGAQVLGIYEQATSAQLARFAPTLFRHPRKLLEGAQYRMQSGFAPYRTGCWVLKAEGGDNLQRVTITNGRKQWTIKCDLLACGFHLVPNLELPVLLGCRVVDGYVSVDDLQQSSRAEVSCIGELTGVGGVEKALLEGEIAGLHAAGAKAKTAPLQRRLRKQLQFTRGLDRAFQLRTELRSLPTADTLVCRCEDVSYQALCRQDAWKAAKLQTRAGMGACQGRVCGSAAEFLFGWQKQDMRPPVFPATVSTMAADLREVDV